MNGRFWSAEDFRTLSEHFPNNRTSEIMHLFPGRTVAAVNNMAQKHEINKSDVFHSLKLGGVKPRLKLIKKEVKNKDWDYAAMQNVINSKKGCFKKENVAHNAKAFGYERITSDGYIEVKVDRVIGNARKNHFQLKHRMMWESQNGPIPEGMIVVINNIDKLNFTIDDLELITRRENVIRNGYSDSSIVKRAFRVQDPETIQKINFTIDDLELITRRENVIRNGYSDSSIVKRAFRVQDPETIQKIISEIPDLIHLKRTNLLLQSKITKK